MLIPIAEISKEFKKDVRTIQLWCAKEGVKKIGNEYQITQEIVDRWRTTRTTPKIKPKAKAESVEISRPKSKNNAFGFKARLHEVIIASFVVAFLFIATIGLVFYSRYLNEDIHAKEKTIESKSAELEAVSKENQDIKNKYNDEYIRGKVIQAIDTFKQGKIITPITKRKPAY